MSRLAEWKHKANLAPGDGDFVKYVFIAITLAILTSQAQGALSLHLKNGNEIELYDKSYALVIGVSDYKKWPDLPGVKGDVKSVSASLEKHGFTVTRLLNPTRAEFDREVRGFIAERGQDPNNRVLIYYAGHGHTLKTTYGGNLGYLVPADAPLPQKDRGTFKRLAISMDEIQTYATQMESKHALFMFDSCFSGSLFEVTRAVPEVISAKAAKPVRQFITAGTGDQTVPDKSVFRAQFVAALNGEADMNTDGYITGTELAQYIENKVTNYTKRAQTPQYGKIRNPRLDKGDYVFTVPGYWERIAREKAGKAEKAKKARAKVRKEKNLQVELAYWDSVRGSDDPALLQTYMKKYPQGRFVDLATVSIQSIKGKDKQRQKAAQRTRIEDQKRLEADTAKRTQELAEQRKLLAELKKQQERLALAKTSTKKESSAETAKRAQELAEQRKLLTEIKKQRQMLAMARPSSAIKSAELMPSGANKKIAVVSYFPTSERGTHARKKSLDRAETIKNIASRFFSPDTNFTLDANSKTAQRMGYDRNMKKRIKLCNKEKTDYVITSYGEDCFGMCILWQQPKNLKIALYRCSNNKLRRVNLTMEPNPGDKWVGENMVQDKVSQFFRNIIQDKSMGQ